MGMTQQASGLIVEEGSQWVCTFRGCDSNEEHKHYRPWPEGPEFRLWRNGKCDVWIAAVTEETQAAAAERYEEIQLVIRRGGSLDDVKQLIQAPL